MTLTGPVDGERLAKIRRWMEQCHPMASARAEVPFHREFAAAEMQALRFGLVPEQMEDRWFGVLAEGSLDFFRSWTGHHIYRLPVRQRGESGVVDRLVVNRDPEQHGQSDDESDVSTVETLLGWMLGETAPRVAGAGPPDPTGSGTHGEERPSPQSSGGLRRALLRMARRWRRVR